MIIFLLLGAVLGGLSVVFVLQNIVPITVTFLTWQISGSLAIVLGLTLIAGMVLSLLVLLPSFIRDEIRFRKVLKRQKELEDELAVARRDLIEAARSAVVTPTPPTVVV